MSTSPSSTFSKLLGPTGFDRRSSSLKCRQCQYWKHFNHLYKSLTANEISDFTFEDALSFVSNEVAIAAQLTGCVYPRNRRTQTVSLCCLSFMKQPTVYEFEQPYKLFILSVQKNTTKPVNDFLSLIVWTWLSYATGSTILKL